MSNKLCGCKGCAVARKPLEEAIQRVRDLHSHSTHGLIDGTGDVTICDYCTDDLSYIVYPCATIKALDGEQ